MGDSATESTESTEVTEGIGMQLLCALGVLGGLLFTTKYTNDTKVLLREFCFEPSRPDPGITCRRSGNGAVNCRNIAPLGPAYIIRRSVTLCPLDRRVERSEGRSNGGGPVLF